MNRQWQCDEPIVCVEAEPSLVKERNERAVQMRRAGRSSAEPNQSWLKREMSEHYECDEQIQRVEANHRWLREMK
jgi:hypothetical protein